MTIWAVLPAAGVGRRMGSAIPKQYLQINGEPLLVHSLRRLCAVNSIQRVVVVLHPEDNHWSSIESSVNTEFEDRVITVVGGDERYQSVLNGLDVLNDLAVDDDWVLVHDAVRPCVRVADIETLIAKIDSHAVGGLLGSAVDNTLKRVDENLAVVETVDRETIWNALTPQMFRYALLRKAIGAVVASGEKVTDEAAAVETAGFRPIMIAGNKDNIKITHEADLVSARQILQAQVENNES